jgi:hypothetical protein
MSNDIVARLREDAEDHKDVAGCCDCDPKDTRNWQHALNNEEAADEIERLRAALEKIAQHDMQAIALDALRLNPVRTRPAKEASDD